MIRAIEQVFRVQSAMSVNRLLYWLGRIPLVKGLRPDRLYGAWRTKQRLMKVVEVLKLLYAFGGKFVYLALLCVLPAALSLGGGQDAPLWPALVWSLFFLSFVTGCWLQSGALTASLIKYTCVRQMGMSARACLAATTGREHLTALLTFTPALMGMAALFGPGWPAGLLLSLELAAMRCVAEFCAVLLYDRTGAIPSKKVWFVMTGMLVPLAAAYGPAAFLKRVPRLDLVLLNPLTVAGLLLLGAGALVWLLRYPGWSRLVRDTCRAENITTAANQNAAQAAFRDVQMKGSDLSAEDGARVSGLRGYAYLNALFFRRHRRILNRPVKYELIGVGVLFGVVCGCALALPGPTGAVMGAAPAHLLPVTVFLMYFLSNTVGARVCKAMFYNCDISLLRFGWYREPKVVLRNFAIRLSRVTGLNLLVGAALCLTVLVPTLLSGSLAAAVENGLFPFLLCILLLSVLFSVHPMFLYYAFQPYTTQLAVKNPFFTWINWGMYMVCILCAQIHEPPRWFTLAVLAVTVLYTAAALLLVWKRSPRTFRVK